MCIEKEITYREAEFSDLESITKFVDYYLAGRGKKHSEKNGNDFFVPPQRHLGYIKSQYVLLAICNNEIVGWLVKTQKNVLIHLLVSSEQRNKGIGKTLLKIANPDIIRCKTDQSTGNPEDFYFANGYKQVFSNKIGKNKNITLLSK